MSSVQTFKALGVEIYREPFNKVVFLLDNAVLKYDDVSLRGTCLNRGTLLREQCPHVPVNMVVHDDVLRFVKLLTSRHVKGVMFVGSWSSASMVLSDFSFEVPPYTVTYVGEFRARPKLVLRDRRTGEKSVYRTGKLEWYVHNGTDIIAVHV
mgnify:CR=1 FL=1